MISWGFASAKDIDAFYESRPRETLRAVVIRIDGEPVGIIGLAKDADYDLAFSEYKPILEPYLKSMPVLRAIKAFMGWVEQSHIPIYTLCATTSGILERVGFQQINGELYQWPGMR